MATKRTFKLAEVCKLLDLQPYVLRYWETEFASLQAGESRGSARGYGAEEVELLRRIKRLLYEEGYTIAGAKKKIEAEPRPGEGSLFEEIGAETGEAEGAPADPPENGVSTTSVSLDTAARERIEKLERGVAEALDEARALLALLESKRR